MLAEAQTAIPVNLMYRPTKKDKVQFIVQYNDTGGFEGPFQTLQQAEAWIIENWDLDEEFQYVIHRLYGR